MGAEFSHLNIANVHEVIACDLKDVMSLYNELMNQKAEFKGINLELEQESRQGKDREQKESSKEKEQLKGKDVQDNTHGHDTYMIEEGGDEEGKAVNNEREGLEEMEEGGGNSIGSESADKQSLPSQLSKESEIDLDIPFQAPQSYVARADFSIAIDELPIIFKDYRKEDISLFTDIYMRMDDLGTDEVSFKDMMICIVLLLSTDVTSCFLNAFKVYDYEKKELLERREFVKIFRTFNMLLENFGTLLLFFMFFSFSWHLFMLNLIVLVFDMLAGCVIC